MRVAINLEQLLQSPPGGVARYTAELTRLLPRLSDGDDAVELAPFVARHRTRDVVAALRTFDLALEPAVLPLPRPLLYDAWHTIGVPGLGRVARRFGALDVVHAPS